MLDPTKFPERRRAIPAGVRGRTGGGAAGRDCRGHLYFREQMAAIEKTRAEHQEYMGKLSQDVEKLQDNVWRIENDLRDPKLAWEARWASELTWPQRRRGWSGSCRSSGESRPKARARPKGTPHGPSASEGRQADE
jgi:hypothetical protein